MTLSLDPVARALLEAFPGHVAVVDRAGIVQAVNAAWARYSVVHPGSRWRPPVGADLVAAYGPEGDGGDHGPGVAAAVQGVLERRQDAFHLDLVEPAPEGERWFALRVAPLQVSAGGAVVILAEITGRKRAETQLAHQALHDPLTGMANRTLFLDRLGLALARLPRRPTGLAVLFLDLDGFKGVNDTLGHTAGDRAIMAVADRIRSVLRPGDTAARMGGDEFTILCEDITSPEDATHIAERVIASVSQPIELPEAKVALTTSVGIAISAEGATSQSMVRAADSAMYHAKQRGPGSWQLAS